MKTESVMGDHFGFDAETHCSQACPSPSWEEELSAFETLRGKMASCGLVSSTAHAGEEHLFELRGTKLLPQLLGSQAWE